MSKTITFLTILDVDVNLKIILDLNISHFAKGIEITIRNEWVNQQIKKILMH